MTKTLLAALLLSVASVATAANTASGTFSLQKGGTISVSQATAYPVRAHRDPHKTQTEVLLTDVTFNAAALTGALDAHMVAINLPELNDRNYVVLAIGEDGGVTMNATFSKTMTQFVDDTVSGRLKVTWTTNTPTRLEGRLFSSAPLKMLDGTTYSVDLTFAADVPAPIAGQALPAGGGDAGKAFQALLAAAERKNWPAVKAASSPRALKMFEEDYRTPAENAASALELLKAWISTSKMKISGGQLMGETAILDVEGEMFPKMGSLSVVRMVKTGTVWQFDQASRAGMLP